MVKIRLSRQGKKNNPFYRVVALDSTQKLSGEALSVLGYWHPQNKVIKIDKKAIDDWVKKGAQVSPAVKSLMEKTAK